MYHYTDCGLDNVWLVNGYQAHDTPYGKGLSIDDIKGLHTCISNELVGSAAGLTGAEFRFLRLELDMSQRQVGLLLDKSEQSVANWEKKRNSAVPKAADVILRAIYREKTGNNAKITQLLAQLEAADRAQAHAKRRLAFKDVNHQWEPARDVA